MNKSDQINELAAALAKAQGKFTPPVKDKTVRTDKYSYRYSDLANTIDAVRGPLSENGLSYTQVLCENPFRLETILMHSSGQWLGSSYQLAQGGTPQQFGSALTYARRYTLNCLLGIAADDDDDGAEAEKGAKGNKQQPPRPAPPPPVVAEDHKPAQPTQKPPPTEPPMMAIADMSVTEIRAEVDHAIKTGKHLQTSRAIEAWKKVASAAKTAGLTDAIASNKTTTETPVNTVEHYVRNLADEVMKTAQPA